MQRSSPGGTAPSGTVQSGGGDELVAAGPAAPPLACGAPVAPLPPLLVVVAPVPPLGRAPPVPEPRAPSLAPGADHPAAARHAPAAVRRWWHAFTGHRAQCQRTEPECHGTPSLGTPSPLTRLCSSSWRRNDLEQSVAVGRQIKLAIVYPERPRPLGASRRRHRRARSTGHREYSDRTPCRSRSDW